MIEIISKEAFETMKVKAYKKGLRQGRAEAIDDVYSMLNHGYSTTEILYALKLLREEINE